jgi:hypothetical protein
MNHRTGPRWPWGTWSTGIHPEIQWSEFKMRVCQIPLWLQTLLDSCLSHLYNFES